MNIILIMKIQECSMVGMKKIYFQEYLSIIKANKCLSNFICVN